VERVAKVIDWSGAGAEIARRLLTSGVVTVVPEVEPEWFAVLCQHFMDATQPRYGDTYKYQARQHALSLCQSLRDAGFVLHDERGMR
jgi:hypothetical protein